MTFNPATGRLERVQPHPNDRKHFWDYDRSPHEVPGVPEVPVVIPEVQLEPDPDPPATDADDLA